jgi:hypothetical protein
LRDRQAEGLGGLEVDDQLEFGGLLHRKIGWLGPPENLVNIKPPRAAISVKLGLSDMSPPSCANSRKP